MLDDVRKSYQECASIISDWKKLSRSELCNKYLEVKDTDKYLAESYLSAIICKFWNVFEHNFKTQHGDFYSEVEYYQSGIDGILEALDRHVWTNPQNKLYGDKNGPEKAINVTIFSLKYNIYQSAFRQKRKVNLGTASLQELAEQGVDSRYTKFEDDISLSEISLTEFIRNQFIHQYYFTSFFLDSILNIDVWVNNNISFAKVKHHIQHLDDKYLKLFSEIYSLDINDVYIGSDYVKRMTSDQINRTIRRVCGELKHNKYIQELVKD